MEVHMTSQCEFNGFSDLYNICNEYQINSDSNTIYFFKMEIYKIKIQYQLEFMALSQKEFEKNEEH